MRTSDSNSLICLFKNRYLKQLSKNSVEISQLSVVNHFNQVLN